MFKKKHDSSKSSSIQIIDEKVLELLNRRTQCKTGEIPSLEAQLRECIRQLEILVYSDDDLLALRSFPLVILIIRKRTILDISSQPLRWIRTALNAEPNPERQEQLKILLNITTEYENRKLNAATVNGCVFSEWQNPDISTFKSHAKFEEIRLNPQQQKQFSAWVRPNKLYSKPLLIANPNGSVQDADIQQSPLVPNCSLISSLLIMARHETVHPGFATHMIYPKDAQGLPMLSPNGCYHVRLFWNGAYRTVIVDDLIPTDKSSKPLCARSQTQGELWPTILEKAYLKLVAGGYDLWTGSNSGIDLYALTGWPPESLPLTPNVFQKRRDIKLFYSDLWAKLILGMRIRDNLITACSRTDINEERSGIPRGHAFAVLDAQGDAKRDGSRRLLLRNPWGHNSKGFWMDLDDMPKYFQSVYVNWNLKLFSHVSHIQCCLPVKEDQDKIGFLRTVQYRITVQPETKLVWAVLSRHVQSIADLESEESALACHAFHSSERVLFPESARVIFKGTYATGPHSVCRIERVGKDGTFVLVLSAYNPRRPVWATLSIFSTSPSTQIEELPMRFHPEKPMLSGQGSYYFKQEMLSKGSPSLNPIWSLKLSFNSELASSCSPQTVLLLPSRIKVYLWVDDLSIASKVRMECELIALDIKMSKKQVLGTSSASHVTSPRPLVVLEAAIPSELLSRTSVRYVIIPKFILVDETQVDSPVLSATTSTMSDTTMPGETKQTADRIDYRIEVDCEIGEAQLVVPDSPESKQQELLRSMLTQFQSAEVLRLSQISF